MQAVLSVSQSMVDCLVEVLLTLDESSGRICYNKSHSTYLTGCLVHFSKGSVFQLIKTSLVCHYSQPVL